ncbi:unnamed protein product [Caenorhabditis auriculariae]|uniref:Uncharacterized protein n=1 Tax=Caenorhabditis auriculariae TaxID=2777116 RepID=A0A8S1HT77_9PELO|nr:unnamed protein product [Caenorhabditis auriculariae]
MTSSIALLLALFVLSGQVNGRSVPCLDGCTCDKNDDDPVIRCDNVGLKRFPLPSTPMRGYHFMALTCNDIPEIPSLSLIKAAFPDLQGIDVQGNARLNCSTDCMHTSEPLQCDKPDDGCDWKCRTLGKLKELWARLKAAVSKKIKDWGAEETVADVSNWFSNQFEKLSVAFGNFSAKHRD